MYFRLCLLMPFVSEWAIVFWLDFLLNPKLIHTESDFEFVELSAGERRPPCIDTLNRGNTTRLRILSSLEWVTSIPGSMKDEPGPMSYMPVTGRVETMYALVLISPARRVFRQVSAHSSPKTRPFAISYLRLNRWASARPGSSRDATIAISRLRSLRSSQLFKQQSDSARAWITREARDLETRRRIGVEVKAIWRAPPAPDRFDSHRENIMARFPVRAAPNLLHAATGLRSSTVACGGSCGRTHRHYMRATPERSTSAPATRASVRTSSLANGNPTCVAQGRGCGAAPARGRAARAVPQSRTLRAPVRGQHRHRSNKTYNAAGAKRAGASISLRPESAAVLGWAGLARRRQCNPRTRVVNTPNANDECGSVLRSAIKKRTSWRCSRGMPVARPAIRGLENRVMGAIHHDPPPRHHIANHNVAQAVIRWGESGAGASLGKSPDLPAFCSSPRKPYRSHGALYEIGREFEGGVGAGAPGCLIALYQGGCEWEGGASARAINLHVPTCLATGRTRKRQRGTALTRRSCPARSSHESSSPRPPGCITARCGYCGREMGKPLHHTLTYLLTTGSCALAFAMKEMEPMAVDDVGSFV
ncbi:hypothetical protein C8R45DRAFT_934707 [Mycena sanguinolenta]|nr:hypothetical protein C8R45DRAFT_934707 [Mycena sanguinolenta]